MAAAAGISVVAVEETEQDAVREGGQLGQRSIRGAEHVRAFRVPDAHGEAARDLRRLVVESAQTAAERVEHAPLAIVDDRGGQIGKPECMRVVGDAGDVGVHDIYSGFAPIVLMRPAHFSVSRRISCAKWSGVFDAGSTPESSSR